MKVKEVKLREIKGGYGRVRELIKGDKKWCSSVLRVTEGRKREESKGGGEKD